MRYVLLHKRAFQILWVLLALICIGLILLVRAGLIPIEWGRYRPQLAFLGAPFAIFIAIHLILMYQTWTQDRGRPIFRSVRLTFFCILSCVLVLILLCLFIYFLI